MKSPRLSELLGWGWVAVILVLYLAQFRPLLAPILAVVG